jgi:nucleoside-diphosphate-sugar epimerase
LLRSLSAAADGGGGGGVASWLHCFVASLIVAQVSIRDVALAVAAAAGLPAERVKFDATKSDGQFKKTACNDKLAKLRPDFEFTPMAVGIKQVSAREAPRELTAAEVEGALVSLGVPFFFSF